MYVRKTKEAGMLVEVYSCQENMYIFRTNAPGR
jgi:hypothetical protein